MTWQQQLIVEGHYHFVDDGILRELAKGLNEVRILVAEQVVSPKITERLYRSSRRARGVAVLGLDRFPCTCHVHPKSNLSSSAGCASRIFNNLHVSTRLNGSTPPASTI